jgi:hypothetical protein
MRACDRKAFAKLSKCWGWDLLEWEDAEDRRKRTELEGKGKEKLDDAEREEGPDGQLPSVRRAIHGSEEDEVFIIDRMGGGGVYDTTTSSRRRMVKDERWWSHEQSPYASDAHPMDFDAADDAFPSEFSSSEALEPAVNYVAPIPEPPNFAADCLLLVRLWLD